MADAVTSLVSLLRDAGVDLVASLPCVRLGALLPRLADAFEHLPLSREEEGVGIAAGSALAGRRPALVMQNSGVGNLLNALLSLTSYYRLPLALFLSHRGQPGEPIAAQVPMGERVGALLEAAGVGCTRVTRGADLVALVDPLERVYAEDRIHAFLLHPDLWDDDPSGPSHTEPSRPRPAVAATPASPQPTASRHELLQALVAPLQGQLVISTLGAPAKEIYALLPQPTTFYMLGSMGMATPVGLGVALSTHRPVYVIDGDGSLLMNPATLALVAAQSPDNLTVIAVDNGVYGSTGGQPTHAARTVHLSALARACGLANVQTVVSPDALAGAVAAGRGPRFVHALALPGNHPSPPVDLSAAEIRGRFEEALRRG